MTMRQRICIVTPGYLSHTPRVVKEADALHAAGFDVHVICSEGQLRWVAEYSRDVAKQKPWHTHTVRWAPEGLQGTLRYQYTRVRHQLFKRLPELCWAIPGVAERAEGRIYSELASAACAVQADLYIGHYPIGLAAAAKAAQKFGAKLGYDVEDLHTEEQANTPEGQLEKRRIAWLERHYLACAQHVSVVSDAIGAVMRERYALASTTTLRNAFPLSERDTLDGKVLDRRGDKLSLYWYSQTIGRGRGLEEILRAAKSVAGKIQLHLRGSISDADRDYFLAIARDSGIANDLYLHDQVPPEQLLARASEHDIGLALEQTQPLSRNLTITNKMFFYVLASIAVIATNTVGQAALHQAHPAIGFLYPQGDVAALSRLLEELVANPQRIADAKIAARVAAEQALCWDREQLKLIEAIRMLFAVR
jgi:glycosyltransferase involved in cell wall biosynthesis